jgi:GNAT superfamily N-acetyltransferase
VPVSSARAGRADDQTRYGSGSARATLSGVDRAVLIARIARTTAENAAAHARVLAEQDPSWGTDVFELAGGRAVLCGPGLYVNRAVAVGLDGPMTDADFELLEARSAAVGVPPAIDVVPTAHSTVAELAGRRGYRLRRFLTTHVLALDPTTLAPKAENSPFVIARADGDLLGVWRDVEAAGFGVDHGEERRVNDAFANAAAVVDGQGFVLATDRSDGRPLGCASVTVRDGLATLGGMTTLPAERGRGVQSALIAHRLHLALAAGCDLAVSSTMPASVSERNLHRAGLRPVFETVTLTREPPPSGSS